MSLPLGPPPLPWEGESPSCNAWPSAGHTFTPQLNKWKEIGALFTILHWIVNGVPLPLHNVPCLHVLCNFHLDNLQVAFMEDKLKHLLQIGAVHLLGSSENTHISPIGVVLKKNGKHHLIINMRLLNVHISLPKFKYKDLSSLTPLLHQGDFMSMIDLKDRFFHIPILHNHQHFMSFWWNDQAYCYQVLPFRMSALPWLFTHFVRTTICHLHCLSIWVMAYMDDIIIISHNLVQAHCHLWTMHELLTDLGWQINLKKSDLVLGQVKEILGLLVNTTGPLTFQVPLRKSHTLWHNIDHLLCLSSRQGQVPVWKLVAVVGQGVVLTWAILLVKLLLWNAYRDIACWSSWLAEIKLSKATIHDLKEWRHGLLMWNGRVVNLCPHDILIDTDVSLSGWGATLAPTLSSLSCLATGWWPKGESCHSNTLEILAVLNTLSTFLPLLWNRAMLICCNNITTVAHLNNMGGCSPPMNTMMQKIHHLCKRSNMQLSASYLPGSKNTEVDCLSCLHLHHKWQIAPAMFKHINNHWGPHSINQTATTSNSQLQHFNSHFTESRSKATDCLLQDWRGENNWSAPPIALIPCILELVKWQVVTATIIAPVWPGCWWFNLLEHLSVDTPICILTLMHSFISDLEFTLEPLCN